MIPTICIIISSSGRRKRRIRHHPSPALHREKKETRASSSTIALGRLPIEHGPRPAHWWEHCTLTEGSTTYLLRPEGELDWDLLDRRRHLVPLRRVTNHSASPGPKIPTATLHHCTSASGPSRQTAAPRGVDWLTGYLI